MVLIEVAALFIDLFSMRRDADEYEQGRRGGSKLKAGNNAEQLS